MTVELCEEMPVASLSEAKIRDALFESCERSVELQRATLAAAGLVRLDGAIREVDVELVKDFPRRYRAEEI